ncbi:MAG: hypothetical protein H7338_01700 [Candidatus Sericytochromatia bacterium]|nr:hypothetical protein [Candidatus Sericytochromatia bacterium]
MTKHLLVTATVAALLSGCSGNIGGLLNTVLGAVMPTSTGASATPPSNASPGTGTSANTVPLTATLTYNGQPAQVVQTVRSTLNASKTPQNVSQYSARWEIGSVTTDGAYLIVVTIVSGKPLNTLDIQSSDLAALSINVSRNSGDLVNQTQNFAVHQIIESGIVLSVTNGRLNVAFKARTSGLGNPADVTVDLKGLPTS